jgi:hypothetical protein
MFIETAPLAGRHRGGNAGWVRRHSPARSSAPVPRDPEIGLAIPINASGPHADKFTPVSVSGAPGIDYIIPGIDSKAPVLD